MIVSILENTLILATPLLLASMAGLLSERSGVINIGLEGFMLVACCVLAVAAPALGPVGAVAVAVLASTVMALLHWMFTQRFRVDHVISGMALNAIAAGGTNFLFQKFADVDRKAALPVLPLWIFEALGLGVPLLLWIAIRYTRPGLRLFAVGSDPDKARLAGISPPRVRAFALAGCGILCGLGGAMLVTYTGNFTDNMTAGRGYIALAALILGGWRPVPAAAASLGFGLFSALKIQFEGQSVLGIQLPSQAWASLPYLATVIALAGFVGRKRSPQGLGKA